MKKYQIPIDFQKSDYRGPTTLGSYEATVESVFRERADGSELGFFISFWIGGELVLSEVRAVSGVNLFDLSLSPLIPEGAELYLHDLDKPSNPKLGRDATWETFGDRVVLICKI